MQFVAMRCRSSRLTPTSRNRRGRPSPVMKRSSTSAPGWPAAPSAALISARLACLVGAGDHRLARAVRGHFVMRAGVAGLELVSDLPDRIGLTIERAPGEDE